MPSSALLEVPSSSNSLKHHVEEEEQEMVDSIDTNSAYTSLSSPTQTQSAASLVPLKKRRLMRNSFSTNDSYSVTSDLLASAVSDGPHELLTSTADHVPTTSTTFPSILGHNDNHHQLPSPTASNSNYVASITQAVVKENDSTLDVKSTSSSSLSNVTCTNPLRTAPSASLISSTLEEPSTTAYFKTPSSPVTHNNNDKQEVVEEQRSSSSSPKLISTAAAAADRAVVSFTPSSNFMIEYDVLFPPNATSVPPKPFKCQATGCIKRYKTLTGLVSHFYTAHVTIDESNPEEKDRPFGCGMAPGVCDKRYRNSNGLSYHISASHGFANHPTAIEAESASADTNEQHLPQKHITEQESALVAVEATSMDASAGNNEFSISSHSSVNDATTVSSSSSSSSSLTSNTESIGDITLEVPAAPLSKRSSKKTACVDKPFICPYVGCGKSYKNANGLAYHLSKGKGGHKDEIVVTVSKDESNDSILRTFACPVDGCLECRSTPNALSSHIRKMHKELATLHSSVSKPEFSNAIMSSSEDKPNEDEEKEEESNDDDERSGQVVADINQEEEKAAAEELKEAEQIV